jgi:predicted dehydrogenase
MIHDIDIILSIVGSEIERVEAVGMPFCSPHIDVAHASIFFKNGCVAHLSASRISQERLRKMIILQKDSYLAVDDIKQSLTITRRGKRGRAEIEVNETVRKNDPLEKQLKAFLQSVREQTSPLVTGEEVQRALEIALQIADVIDKATQ